MGKRRRVKGREKGIGLRMGKGGRIKGGKNGNRVRGGEKGEGLRVGKRGEGLMVGKRGKGGKRG